MARADDLHPVGKDHDADRSAGEVVPMDQCIDQQLFQRRFRNLQLAQCIEASPVLYMVKVALDEGESAPELLQ